MKKQHITIYLSNEANKLLLDMWYQRRSQDRKTNQSDIVEEAIKYYASNQMTNNLCHSLKKDH